MFIEIYSKSSFSIAAQTDTFILLQESDDYQFMPIIRVPQDTIDDLKQLTVIGQKKVIFSDRFEEMYEILHQSGSVKSVDKLSRSQCEFYRKLIA